MPKFLGFFSINGLTTFFASTTLDLSGAAATLLLPFFKPFTGFLTPGLAGLNKDYRLIHSFVIIPYGNLGHNRSIQ